MNNNVQKDNDRKKITFLVIAIMVIMITTTSSTYAFLALSANDTNNITGTVATTSLVFGTTCGSNSAPTLIAPATSTYQNTPMVPQLAYNASASSSNRNVLQLALNGARGKDKCVDSNNNAICRAYTITVKNCSTAGAHLTGTISFSPSNITTTMPNLKWKVMTNATTVAVTSATDTNIKSANTTEQVFVADSGLVAPNGTVSYSIIFWIQETGDAQTDTGTWYATVKFDSSAGGGITSTITGA